MNAASKGPDVDDDAHEIEALAFKVSEEFDQCLCAASPCAEVDVRNPNGPVVHSSLLPRNWRDWKCLVCKNTVTFALLPPRSGLDTARSLWNGMVDGD